ncbi:DUF2207 domain-containing protein [Bacillus sp. FSL K6-3431]|uniref:DUF2207 domain-containing protein n=1 Tax=Bacillus sp. FSL K6-3431 TaxID=2921500 RepID=UPI0030F9CC26
MKKPHIILLFALLFFAIFAPQASARSFTIDEAHIRIMIAPDGNLLVNEMFTYTFNGTFENVRRSIHTVGHNGVKDFEAYELMNPNASLNAISKNDLRQLDVIQNENSYTGNLLVKNTSKQVVYVYILENAVKSYKTYSDITVPFFGTDSNHDTDLQNVTIDFVFPNQINPNQYHAFFHDEEGYIVQKTEEMIRFFTPLSKMHMLTETRLLFPSAIMTEQSKQAEPRSLETVLKDEEKALESAMTRSSTQKSFRGFLPILSGLFAVATAFLLLLPQRRLRNHIRPEDLLKYDPLYLYVIDRAGEKDGYAFLAGVYSLVEKGYATVRKTSTLTRFQQDTEAPKNTLSFTFHPPSSVLAESEKMLLDWLFTRKSKLGTRIFSMNNIYGATKREKEAKNVHGYYRKQIKRQQHEENWFDCVLNELTEKKWIRGKLYPIATRVLMIMMMIITISTYFIGASSGFGIILYLVISAYLLKRAWSLLTKKRVLLFFFFSMISGWLAIDPEFIPGFIFFTFAVSICYLTIPRYILNREATEMRAEIRQFRKWIQKEGIPSGIDETELEKWMTRAVLLKVKTFELDVNQFNRPIEELASIAPMAVLILNNEDPASYLLKTWKWSDSSGKRLFDSSDNEKNNSGDSSGGSSFSSDSGGGDDGGGAGAD